MKTLGDLIGGSFHQPVGEPFSSANPAQLGKKVFDSAWSVERVDEACSAAALSAQAWAALSIDERYTFLLRFKEAIASKHEAMAHAIMSETGKLWTEAKGEVAALMSRVAMVRAAVESDLKGGELPGHPGEELRYHALGVVGVIGPYNYPLHLCNAHVIPALLMGNAVVIKPSEVAPLSAQLYAECALEAKFPDGVFNLVQGRGASGAKLAANESVRGLCFTGSYNVGHQLSQQALERPELLLALEMGGKNTVVVMEDADIPQAAHEIIVGAYLTAGQRCTATDRVLVSQCRADELCRALKMLAKAVHFGAPDDPKSFAGPLATEGALEKYKRTLELVKTKAERIHEGPHVEGGSFAPTTIHRLPDGEHDVEGYTNEELFGPDIGVETFKEDDEAIAVLAASPYGLANSVFTFSDERFERVYRNTHSGILNRNRSTNMASPRLPFGGTGKSGNFRPAGAWAARNVVSAVAVQENVIGRVQVHPQLIDRMPPPELDRLEARHAEEDCKEAARDLISDPRPMAVSLPLGGVLPKSNEWLTRLYAAERVVREKKPPVFDHLRSQGPYLVSVDDKPMSVLDGMSQTATLCGGFAENAVVRAYTEGAFGDMLVRNEDWTVMDHPAAQDFATVLRQSVSGVPEVTFTNSGAEANEKAFCLARLASNHPTRNKVLAFEGSFHGRTLLALSATYNPVKREPYEFAGYESLFAPFPLWSTPMETEPLAPSGFFAAAGRGDLEGMQQRFGDSNEDALLASEVASLAVVHQSLLTEEVFAVVIEPMQSEGGDRYATTRFFRALRLLTRHHKVALIFDEVQTGFGLGGPFAWHSRFNLVNFKGQPDYPDAVTFAKRAQVGVCMSVWPDPEPTPTQTASLLRGKIHAEMASASHHAERIQKLVTPRLQTLAQGFPHLVADPRATGYALAFDLPTKEHLVAYLGQRFWRGAVVFGAGTRTVRYRLSEGFWAREIDELFVSIRRSLAWLDAHPGAKPPAWEDFPSSKSAHKTAQDIVIREVAGQESIELLPAILDIEYQVYEPARRTPPEEIRVALEDPDGIILVAETNDASKDFIGFVIGHPLEKSAEYEEGPDRDPMLGQNNSLYSMSLTVLPAYHGQGIGRRLKRRQLETAKERKNKSGDARYRYVTGRNRVGHTAAMTHLNQAYGAHLVDVLMGQYEDPEGQAIYYRIPLAPWTPRDSANDSDKLRLDQGLSLPLASPPQSLKAAEHAGLLYGPAVNKLTIMNYATPGMIRALEWIGALAPKLPHMYLTSCRDELFDKSIRLLRTHRKKAQVPIGLVGSYVGHTSAAARSLSDPTLHDAGQAHYAWPLVPHPGDVGGEASLSLLRETIKEKGGPSNVLGIYVEVVQERSGATLDKIYAEGLNKLRHETGIPIVCMETGSAGYRSGLGAFAHQSIGLKPDVLTWWGGAQTGYMHVTGEMRVAKPLTLVSTWDGDELSMIREQHQLRALRRLEMNAGLKTLDDIAQTLTENGMRTRGLGFYRVIEAKARADEFESALQAKGVYLKRFGGGRLGIIPPMDKAVEALQPLAQALKGFF